MVYPKVTLSYLQVITRLDEIIGNHILTCRDMCILRISGRQLVGSHALQSEIEIMHVEYVKPGSTAEGNRQIKVL